MTTPTTDLHKCLHPECERQITTNLFACRNHWHSLPLEVRSAIWSAYEPGQEIGGVSPEWLKAATKAIVWWRTHESKRLTSWVPPVIDMTEQEEREWAIDRHDP